MKYHHWTKNVLRQSYPSSQLITDKVFTQQPEEDDINRTSRLTRVLRVKSNVKWDTTNRSPRGRVNWYIFDSKEKAELENQTRDDLSFFYVSTSLIPPPSVRLLLSQRPRVAMLQKWRTLLCRGFYTSTEQLNLYLPITDYFLSNYTIYNWSFVQ